MKPDQYRIENRKPGVNNWGTFEYVSSLSESSVIKRASALSSDSPGADWRVLLYWEVVDKWVITWESPAGNPKPTDFEHRGVKLTFREDGGINIKSPRREQYESGGAALEDHEVAALRAYFASEGK